MTLRITYLALILGACSSGTPSDHATPATRPRVIVAAPSPAALDAQRVARDYFSALDAKDYPRAYRLWGNAGTDAGGSLRAFSQVFERFATYHGEAGAPGEVRVGDGVDYILVEAKAETKDAKGKAAELSGVLMLKRPTGKAAPWTIWGADIRRRQCHGGQVARGLGCIQPSSRS